MRVVIVEDSVLLREGLGRILAEYGDEVVAALGTADELVPTVTETAPDIVIADVRMPPTHTDEGLRAAIDLRRQRPGTSGPGAVAVRRGALRQRAALGGHPGGRLPAQGASGRRGRLRRRRPSRRVGGTVLDPEVVAQLLARRRSGPLDSLTPREREVLALMAEGRSNAGIAQALVVSDGAVEKHISSIFGRLGLAPTDTEHRRVLAVLTYLKD